MNKVDCPKCGGYGHDGFEEESGCPYACYFCGASGLVDEAVANEYYRDMAWGAYKEAEARIMKKARLGIPADCGYYYDEDSGEVVIVYPKAARQAVDAWPIEEFDDIPY